MVALNKVDVEFSEVGRFKQSWTLRINPTDEAIIKAIRRKRCLASRDIDLVWNEDKSGAVIVVGGTRTVGRFALQRKENDSWHCTN